MQRLKDSLPAILIIAGGMLFVVVVDGWRTALLFIGGSLALYAATFGLMWLLAGVIEAVIVRRNLRTMMNPFRRTESGENPYQSPGSF